MEGYIVRDTSNKKNLTNKLFWYTHENESGDKPYVFSKEEVEHIKRVSQELKWEVMPMYIIRARWTEEKGLEILGKAEPIWTPLFQEQTMEMDVIKVVLKYKTGRSEELRDFYTLLYSIITYDPYSITISFGKIRKTFVISE